MTRYFALHDYDPALKERFGAFEVKNKGRLKMLNEEGYGIFMLVNEFNGKRALTNLAGINYWFCEIDCKSKSGVLSGILETSLLLPTRVVESKNGYHLYWAARNSSANLDLWDQIVRQRLVPFYKADHRATDVTRILRVPSFFHMKDPDDPFQVRVVFESPHGYTAGEMLAAFPLGDVETNHSDLFVVRDRQPRSFWEAVAMMDARKVLKDFSGDVLMGRERVDFKLQNNGNYNIVVTDVDGRKVSTPCFVDRDGYMGGVEGGNSVAAYFHWYGHSWATIAQRLKDMYPELRRYSE